LLWIFLDENGDREGKILVKSDQEPSVVYLIKDLVEARPEGRTVVEESPVKSSGSNGNVERGIQEVEGSIRKLFLGLQERVGRSLDARERIVAFIPDYAAYLWNRLAVGSDGKVPYERIKGKKPTVLGLEFGEKLLYKIKLKSRLEKINQRWDYGIFVGVRRRSNEVVVCTKEGLITVRSVRRIPVEERWGEDCVEWVRWAPWYRYRGDDLGDGDLPEGIPESERVVPEDKGDKVVYVDTRTKVPREFYISKKDAEKYGYSRACPGCDSLRGLGRGSHTPGCRERFRDLMKDDAKVKNQVERKRAFEEGERVKRQKMEESAGAPDADELLPP
jgi:hypothetical protein